MIASLHRVAFRLKKKKRNKTKLPKKFCEEIYQTEDG